MSVWLTDAVRRMEAQPGLAFSGAGSGRVIVVDEGRRFQPIEGFGASFTDSAAYLLNQVATPASRDASMRDLFTRQGTGIGVSFVRNPMGASDLARFIYSYDDLPPGQTDPGLSRFSMRTTRPTSSRSCGRRAPSIPRSGSWRAPGARRAG